MDMLLFVVMGPFFLLLGCCWIAGAIERHKNNKMHKQAKRNAKRFGELCKYYESQGMPWQHAAALASEETQLK